MMKNLQQHEMQAKSTTINPIGLSTTKIRLCISLIGREFRLLLHPGNAKDN